MSSGPLSERKEYIEPQVGQVYQTERGDEYYQILYIDEQVVLLRSSEKGRNNQNGHRIERRISFDRQIESGWFSYRPDSEINMTSYEAEDWAEVSYVGEMTAENLHESGFETALDIQQSSDDELLSVDGVGQRGAENLREFAR